MRNKICILLTSLLIVINLSAQKNSLSAKFGDISEKDFEPKVYSLDSSAQAVILYDGGYASYEGDNNAWFNLVYKYHKRIRLLNKNAYDEATIQIPLYKNSKEEDKISDFEAVTYNIENGKVIKTKVNKESIFKDNVNKNVTVQKFTFPNLNEGCIIEYTYTVTSPSANYLRSWYFQGQYPVLKSEYAVTIPTLFNFLFLKTGYYPLDPKVTTGFHSYTLYEPGQAFSSGNTFSYNATTINSKWELENIEPIKSESYTTTLQNHISKIEFKLNSLHFPNEPMKPVMGTWAQAATALLNNEQFGLALSEKNNWMNDDVEKLTKGKTDIEAAENIFKYVRDNYTCTDHDALYIPKNLKTSYQAKKGNVIEVNMVLTSMLKKANLKANPVLLSTRDNGIAVEHYPFIDKFNYVITKLEIGDKTYLLDASVKKLGFDKLPSYCYNGYGRTISSEPFIVPLLADSLKESKITSIFITNNDDKSMSASFTSNLGYFESHGLRQELSTKSSETFFKEIKSKYSFDIKMSNTAIDSLDNYNIPAMVKYDFDFTPEDDLIYFQPLLTEAYKKNPFTANTRNYPVEMPFKTSELIVMNMDIPTGYKVDELPKSARVKLNETDGMFEYLIQADASKIQLRSKITLNKATFSADDYETLRNFYGYIVQKQNEQIVFKKIN